MSIKRQASLCVPKYTLRAHTVTYFSIGIHHFVQILVNHLGLYVISSFRLQRRFLEIKREPRLSGTLRSHENETQ